MDLSCEYGGLRLANPLIAAPAGTTGTRERCLKCAEQGIGALVLKSLFEQEFSRKAPTPHFKVIRRGAGAFVSTTLYSYEQASEFGPEEYCAELAAIKQATGLPIFASINCYTDEGWISYAKQVEQAGADAIELNASCPHGFFAMAGADIGSEVARITSLVKSAVSIPVTAKLSGQDAYPPASALKVQQAGAAGVVLFNRFTGLEIDLETERPIMHGGYAGHGGPWALQFVLRWLTEAAPQLAIPISASGGVVDGKDVAKLILAGATTVQLCTAIVVEGYQVIGRIKRELTEFMQQKHYSCLADFRGKVIPRLVTGDQVDREWHYRAQVDSAKCIRCGKCERVCIYFAPVLGEKASFINPERCAGCGLCVELCPMGAIELVAR